MKTTIIKQIKGITANMVMAVLIAGCTAPEKQQVVEKQTAIQPPFAGLVPAFDEYAVDAANGDTIITTSGTRIIIPPHGLVDDSGNVVTGLAKIKYREYHDALDVFLSGIPMDYMSQGQKRIMQTAGMFEIRAEKGGRELKLAQNKKMEIIFASFESGADYNFFSFNENKNEWEFVDYSKPVVNPEKEVIKKRIAEMRPGIKVPFDKDNFVLNYNQFIDVYFNNDLEKIYSYRNMPVFKNKAAKYGLKMFDLYEMYSDAVSYQGNMYPAALMVWKNLSGYDFPRWTKGHFCDVERIKGNVYLLTVSDYKKKKTMSLKAECIMPLKYLFKLNLQQWKNDYAETMRQIAVEERRLQAEAEVNRAIEISGFGIYNFDKLMKMDNALRIAAAFEIDEPVDNQAYKPDVVYCFTGDNKTVIKLPSSRWKYLWLDPDDNHYRLFTILPGNKIAVFPVKKYRDIDFRSLKRTEDPSYTFVLETQDKTIGSKADLERLLNI